MQLVLGQVAFREMQRKNVAPLWSFYVANQTLRGMQYLFPEAFSPFRSFFKTSMYIYLPIESIQGT